MKYRIIIVCFFLMLLICSVFVNASIIDVQITENNTVEELVTVEDSTFEYEAIDNDLTIELYECDVDIVMPKPYYIHTQWAENMPPLYKQPWPFLEVLNLCIYICLGASQMFVDTDLDCPDAAYACFHIENMLGTIEQDYCDTDISVSDVIYLINYLFKSGPSPNPILIVDVDCNCEVSVTDIIFLINYLFKDGPPPDC